MLPSKDIFGQMNYENISSSYSLIQSYIPTHSIGTYVLQLALLKLGEFGNFAFLDY